MFNASLIAFLFPNVLTVLLTFTYALFRLPPYLQGNLFITSVGLIAYAPLQVQLDVTRALTLEFELHSFLAASSAIAVSSGFALFADLRSSDVLDTVSARTQGNEGC